MFKKHLQWPVWPCEWHNSHCLIWKLKFKIKYFSFCCKNYLYTSCSLMFHDYRSHHSSNSYLCTTIIIEITSQSLTLTIFFSHWQHSTSILTTILKGNCGIFHLADVVLSVHCSRLTLHNSLKMASCLGKFASFGDYSLHQRIPSAKRVSLRMFYETLFNFLWMKSNVFIDVWVVWERTSTA